MNGELVVERPEGLYCPAGDFFIDPWRPVARAVVTHAHADHARRGHGAYLAQADGAAVLRARLGPIALQTLAYSEPVELGGVRLSLHPAGHVLGSAQVRIEHRGEVWVVSGDYFVAGDAEAAGAGGDPNPTCPAFEPLRCHCFVTESTFGLPLYRWRAPRELLAEVDAWWRANADAGRASLLLAYSFGKAQRLLAGVDASTGPIVVHGAVAAMNEACRAAGARLPATVALDAVAGRAALARALVVAPPAVLGSAWTRRLGPHASGLASGWMQLRGARRRRGVDRGFALSDHADWPGLLRAIDATGAGRVIVTHGQEEVLVRWLRERGLDAGRFRTAWGDDEADESAPERAALAAPADDAAVGAERPGASDAPPARAPPDLSTAR